MRNAPRILLFGLIASLFLVLAACGDDDDDDVAAPAASPAPPAAAPGEVEEVVFWYWADTPAIGVFFRDLIDDFNNTHPNVKVKGEVQPAFLAAREKMALGAVAGTGPDVTYGNITMALEFDQAGWVQHLDEFFDGWDGSKDFFPKVVELSRASTDAAPLIMLSAVYGVNFQYYRKDIYDAAGLKPATTVDEMFEIAKKTTKSGQAGYGLRAADGIGFGYNVMNLLVAEGMTFTDFKGGSDLDSPLAIATMKRVAQAYYDGLTNGTAIQDRFPQMVAGFQQGKIAQWAAETVHFGMLRGEDGEFTDTIGVAPHVKGQAGQFAPIAPNGYIMLAHAKSKAASWEFMEFLGEPAQVEGLASIVSFAPSLQSLANAQFVLDNPAIKLSVDLAPYYYSYPYAHKNWTKMIMDTAPTLWQRVLLKEIEVEEMAKQLADLMREQ